MEVRCESHTPAVVCPKKESPVSVEFEAGWTLEPAWALRTRFVACLLLVPSN